MKWKSPIHPLLLQHSEVEEVPKGKMLVREGEFCKYLYFIEKGYVTFFYDRNARNINVHFAFEHQYVTNLKCFLYGERSDYYIQTGERTLLRKMDRSQAEVLFQGTDGDSSFKNQLMGLLISQEEHNHLFKIYTPAERYHYVAKYHPMLLQRISLSQLSSYLGTSRETICRIRRNTMFLSEAV